MAAAATQGPFLVVQNIVTDAELDQLEPWERRLRIPRSGRYTSEKFRVLCIVYFGMDPMPAARLFECLPKVTIVETEYVTVNISHSAVLNDWNERATILTLKSDLD